MATPSKAAATMSASPRRRGVFQASTSCETRTPKIRPAEASAPIPSAPPTRLPYHHDGQAMTTHPAVTPVATRPPSRAPISVASITNPTPVRTPRARSPTGTPRLARVEKRSHSRSAGEVVRPSRAAPRDASNRSSTSRSRPAMTSAAMSWLPSRAAATSAMTALTRIAWRQRSRTLWSRCSAKDTARGWYREPRRMSLTRSRDPENGWAREREKLG